MATAFLGTDAQFERYFENLIAQDFENMIAAIPPREELEKRYTFSARHEARMERLFRLERRKHMFDVAARWTRTAAAAIIAAIALSSAMLLAFSPGVRAAVSETIIQWFDGFTRFIGGEHGEANIEPGGWRAGYLPEGFAESETLEILDMTRILYTDSVGNEIRLTIAPSGEALSVNNDDTGYSAIKVDGTNYHLFASVKDYRPNIIVWYSDGLRFELLSEISIDELLLTALSVVQ